MEQVFYTVWEMSVSCNCTHDRDEAAMLLKDPLVTLSSGNHLRYDRISFAGRQTEGVEDWMTSGASFDVRSALSRRGKITGIAKKTG